MSFVQLGSGRPPRLEYVQALVDFGAALRRRNKRVAARVPLRQALELASEALADVDPDGRVLHGCHEDLADLVRHEVFDHQLREHVRVARRRVDGVEARIARGAVVGVMVPLVAARGRRSAGSFPTRSAVCSVRR